MVEIRKIAKEKSDRTFDSTRHRRSVIRKLLKKIGREALDIEQENLDKIEIGEKYWERAEEIMNEKPSINEVLKSEMTPCGSYRYRGHPVPKQSKMKGYTQGTANIQFKTGVKDYLCANCHRTFDEEELNVDTRCPRCDNETLTKIRPSTRTRTIKCR